MRFCCQEQEFDLGSFLHRARMIREATPADRSRNRRSCFMASAATTSSERLLSIEEYQQLPANGQRTELVRGRIITLNPPFPWHGYVCGNVILLAGGFVRDQDRGYVVSNDAGVVTARNPDTLRGADFAFYSYKRVPKGSLAKRGYLAVAPDLVIEVRSPDDLWKDILGKVVEYLNAGVR